jgi:thioester reductase-like protein
MSDLAGRNILVTGAAGAVGVEVTVKLASAGAHVTALVHRNGTLTRNNGRAVGAMSRSEGSIDVVKGDVTQPDLGLPALTYRDLQARTDLVIHAAAVTEFGLDANVYYSVNVGGTRNVISLAESGNSAPIPVLYISTAYICGERNGVALESELDVGQVFGNAYEHSKFQAEQLLREAASGGLSLSVVRPSIVVGMQKTGAIREFKNLYVMVKIVTQGRVVYVPGDYDALLDLVPVDYVASVICQVASLQPLPTAQTFHAVGGGIALLDVSNVLAEYPAFHVPRYIPPQSFDVSALSALERRYHESIVRLYESYLRRHVEFDDTATRTLLQVRPTVRRAALLRKVLDYAVDVGYMRPRNTPVSE